MLAFDEALARVLDAAPRLESERLPLLELSGRVLAERLVAEKPIPAFDYSAMDGYALRSVEFTADGRLRHPAFLGLRTDKKPSTVVRER